MAKSKPVEIVDPEVDWAKKGIASVATSKRVKILGEKGTNALMELLIELGAKALVRPMRSGAFRGGKEEYGQIVEVRGFSFIVDKTSQ